MCEGLNSRTKYRTDCGEPNRGLHRQIVMQNMHSCELLRSVEWLVISSVSGQPIGHFFKSSRHPKERTYHN